jgi:hypothetical protein
MFYLLIFRAPLPPRLYSGNKKAGKPRDHRVVVSSPAGCKSFTGADLQVIQEHKNQGDNGCILIPSSLFVCRLGVLQRLQPRFSSSLFSSCSDGIGGTIIVLDMRESLSPTDTKDRRGPRVSTICRSSLLGSAWRKKSLASYLVDFTF